MNVYVDGRRHKHNSFRTRTPRDAEVKELRRDGWNVKVGKHNDVDGSGEIYWYEATKPFEDTDATMLNRGGR